MFKGEIEVFEGYGPCPCCGGVCCNAVSHAVVDFGGVDNVGSDVSCCAVVSCVVALVWCTCFFLSKPYSIWRSFVDVLVSFLLVAVVVVVVVVVCSLFLFCRCCCCYEFL